MNFQTSDGSAHFGGGGGGQVTVTATAALALPAVAESTVV